MSSHIDVPIFSQKITALNESNATLKERIDLLQKEKVRCVVCMETFERGPLKFRLIHVRKLVRRVLYECMEKVSVRKNWIMLLYTRLGRAKCDPPYPGKKDIWCRSAISIHPSCRVRGTWPLKRRVLLGTVNICLFVTLVHLCILGKRERRFIRDGYHWKTWEGAFKSMLANQKFNGWPFLSSFPSKEMRSYPLPLDAFESVPNLKKTLGIVAFVVSVKSIDSTNAQIKQLIVLRLFKIN